MTGDYKNEEEGCEKNENRFHLVKILKSRYWILDSTGLGVKHKESRSNTNYLVSSISI